MAGRRYLGGGGSFHAPGDPPERSFDGWKDERVVLRGRLAAADRLARDGWQRHVTPTKHFSKPVSRGWHLCKILRRVEVHELRHDDGRVIACPGWTWADVDAPRKRVVYAEAGKLFAASTGHGGLVDPRELFDANPMTFDPAPAPYDIPTTIVER